MTADLHRAVQTTLASKRLGRPVFVRYVLHGQDKAENIPPRLAVLTATVGQWLGQPLDRIHATGSVETGQVSLTLRFTDGATALVSVNPGRPHGSGVDLMVLGNRGAIYDDAGSGTLWDDVPDPPGRPDPELLKKIEQALRAAKSQPEGQP